MFWALVTVSSILFPSVCVTCRHNWPLFSQAHHQTPSRRQPAPEPASTHPISSVEGLERDLAPLPAGPLRSRQSHRGALPLPARMSGSMQEGAVIPTAIIVQMANIPTRDTATHPRVMSWPGSCDQKAGASLRTRSIVTFLKLLCIISLKIVFSVCCLGWFC